MTDLELSNKKYFENTEFLLNKALYENDFGLMEIEQTYYKAWMEKEIAFRVILLQRKRAILNCEINMMIVKGTLHARGLFEIRLQQIERERWEADVLSNPATVNLNNCQSNVSYICQYLASNNGN